MLKRRYLWFYFPFIVLLAACSSKPKTPRGNGDGRVEPAAFLLEPQHNMMQMGGDFANNPAAAQFIDKMVARSTASIGSSCRRSCRRQAPGLRPAADGSRRRPACRQPGRPAPGCATRNSSLPPDNVQNGVVFWNQISGRAQPRLSGFTACRRKSSSVLSAWETRWGPGDGQNPDPRRAGDAVV